MSTVVIVSNSQTGSIRPAEVSDLDEIVRIHCLAFPKSFLTLLGPKFLALYYQLVWTDPGGILLLHENAGEIDAFIAGFLQPSEFYARMKKIRWAAVRCLAAALRRQPSLAGRIFYHIRRLIFDKTLEHPHECELSSLAVRPGEWSRGTGSSLVRAFLETAWSSGARCVYLTTEAKENARTNMFYQRLGFQLRKSFVQYRGRLLNEYIVFRNGK